MMGDARMMAAHVGVDRFELVDESVLEQEIERAIHRRRRRVAAIVLEPVEQIIGLDRLVGCGDQLEHLQPDLGQPQPALLARSRHLAHERLGVVRMVMLFRVCGLGGHGRQRVPRPDHNSKRGARFARDQASPSQASAPGQPFSARGLPMPERGCRACRVVAARAGWKLRSRIDVHTRRCRGTASGVRPEPAWATRL